MSFSKPCYPEDQAARYELILAQAVSLLDETLNPIANLANMAALLADALPRINWCGFYLLDGGMLTLGPFSRLHKDSAGARRMRHGRPERRGSARRRCARLSRPYRLRQRIPKRDRHPASPSVARHRRSGYRQS